MDCQRIVEGRVRRTIEDESVDARTGVVAVVPDDGATLNPASNGVVRRRWWFNRRVGSSVVPVAVLNSAGINVGSDDCAAPDALGIRVVHFERVVQGRKAVSS